MKLQKVIKITVNRERLGAKIHLECGHEHYIDEQQIPLKYWCMFCTEAKDETK